MAINKKQIADVMRHLGKKSSPAKTAAARLNAKKKRPKKPKDI